MAVELEPARQSENFLSRGTSVDWRNNPRVHVKGIDENRNAACVEITDYTSWMHTAGQLPGARILISGITGGFELSVPLAPEKDHLRNTA